MKLLAIAALVFICAGCYQIDGAIQVPYNQDSQGYVQLCSTQPNGKGQHYATSESGGCPYPLTNPAKQDPALWCQDEPKSVTQGDPLCAKYGG